MATNPNVDSVVDALGVVLKKGSNEIIKGIFLESDPIIEACRTVSGVQIGNVYFRVSGKTSEVAQGYYGAKFSHKGDVEFSPCKILQYGHKINTLINPTQAIANYLGEMGLWNEEKAIEAQDIAKWILTLLYQQVREDHISTQLYKGVYVDHTATPDSAHDAVDAMNGLKYILQNGDYSALHVPNYLDCGELSTDPETLYNQVNAAVKDIPEKYRFTVAMTLFMSLSNVQLYWEGREIVTGLRIRTDDGDRNKIPNTNIMLKGSPSMIGTTDFFVVRPGNLVRLIDKSGLETPIKPQVVDYDVKLLSNPFGLGYGFDYLEEVWTNVASGSGS